jgi:RND family efflux transporter MFP subunit
MLPDPRTALSLAAIACVLSLSSACSRSSASPSDAQAAAADAAPVTVPAARVARSDIASRTILTAEFQPFQEIDVMAKVAGYVRTISVDLGDRLREGQVFAELEIPEMANDLSKASAVVEQTQSEIAAARDELQRAESAHEIVHLSYTRLQEVAHREAGLIPRQELDESHSRDLVAEAQLASARSKLRVEENKTRVAQAEEARARTLEKYVTIAAPFEGVVTKRYANRGAMIQAGISSQSQAMPLIRLSQLSTLRLTLPVPESLVPGVRSGQPVEVRVKSLGRSFEGRVARFAEKLDPGTRTMSTEVDVPNPSGVILPGMYAEVALQVERHDRVLALPLEAIERSGGSTRVYLVDSGAIRIVPVQLGLEDARSVEIASGVKEGDVVVAGRRTGLNAGDKVAPKLVEP